MTRSMSGHRNRRQSSSRTSEEQCEQDAAAGREAAAGGGVSRRRETAERLKRDVGGSSVCGSGREMVVVLCSEGNWQCFFLHQAPINCFWHALCWANGCGTRLCAARLPVLVANRHLLKHVPGFFGFFCAKQHLLGTVDRLALICYVIAGCVAPNRCYWTAKGHAPCSTLCPGCHLDEANSLPEHHRRLDGLIKSIVSWSAGRTEVRGVAFEQTACK